MESLQRRRVPSGFSAAGGVSEVGDGDPPERGILLQRVFWPFRDPLLRILNG